MRAEVIIPWAPDTLDADRVHALKWTVGQWQQLGMDVLLGHSMSDAWSKGAAVGHALTRTDADVLIVADADVWCDDIGGALDVIGRGNTPWAVPHRNVHRLTSDATRDVYEGARPVRTMQTVHTPYRGVEGGGLVVLTRAAYEQVPLDPRFVGWGGEDHAWGAALRTMFGPCWRGLAPLFHLWHELAPRQSEFMGSRDNEVLQARYRRAKFPRQMRALLDEIGETDAAAARVS